MKITLVVPSSFISSQRINANWVAQVRAQFPEINTPVDYGTMSLSGTSPQKVTVCLGRDDEWRPSEAVALSELAEKLDFDCTVLVGRLEDVLAIQRALEGTHAVTIHYYSGTLSSGD